jgi:hypothetical protein
MNLDDKTWADALAAMTDFLRAAYHNGAADFATEAPFPAAPPIMPSASAALVCLLTVLDAAPKQRTDSERVAWAMAMGHRPYSREHPPGVPRIKSNLGRVGFSYWSFEPTDESLGPLGRDPDLSETARAIIDAHMDKEQGHE